MYTFKIDDVEFNDGSSLPLGQLNVIIGPNNAGKSRLLKDVVAKTTVTPKIEGTLLKKVNWALPDDLDLLRQNYDVERFQNEQGQWLSYTLSSNLCSEHVVGHGNTSWDFFNRLWIQQAQFRSPQTPNEENQRDLFVRNFGMAMMAFLTTEERLQLVKSSSSPQHEKQTASLLQALYGKGRSVEQEIRSVVKNVFGKEVVLDYSSLQNLLLRVGDDLSHLPSDPRDAREILADHDKLDEQGDGIRSFVGIVVALLAVKRSVFLIDEPEAFLHPPQAFRIGEFLAHQSHSTRQVIIATHSADVLRGLLSKSNNANIIRIDRSEGKTSVRRLDPSRLKDLVSDPLLSSARVLDGLFYSAAVVVEADSDARFYHAVSRKQWSGMDLHFVNADNKQTVPRITRLYRDMGVRCAGIVDFDVLNDKSEFEAQLNSLGTDPTVTDKALKVQQMVAEVAKATPIAERLLWAKNRLQELRQSIPEIDGNLADEKLMRRIENGCKEISESTKGWKPLKQQGRQALPEAVQTSFDELWETCASNGLFINPCGELESMLIEYGIPATSDKRGWIRQALQLVPSLERDDSKQPWKFMESLQNYLHLEEQQQT